VIESVDRLFIVYEFVDGGELYDYMMSKQYLTGTSPSLAVRLGRHHFFLTIIV
jgi:hypothetical protein